MSSMSMHNLCHSLVQLFSTTRRTLCREPPIYFNISLIFLGFMNAPRLILDLNNGETNTDEDVARDISNKLYEEKDTLLREYEVLRNLSILNTCRSACKILYKQFFVFSCFSANRGSFG